MNSNDSEVVAAVLAQAGYAQAAAPESADLVLLNTCAIRENAEAKVGGLQMATRRTLRCLVPSKGPRQLAPARQPSALRITPAALRCTALHCTVQIWQRLGNKNLEGEARTNLEIASFPAPPCTMQIWKRLGYYKNLKGEARRARRPPPVVGVLGCMAERLKQRLLESDRLVDVVAGPDAYRRAPACLPAGIRWMLCCWGAWWTWWRGRMPTGGCSMPVLGRGASPEESAVDVVCGAGCLQSGRLLRRCAPAGSNPVPPPQQGCGDCTQQRFSMCPPARPCLPCRDLPRLVDIVQGASGGGGATSLGSAGAMNVQLSADETCERPAGDGQRASGRIAGAVPAHCAAAAAAMCCRC